MRSLLLFACLLVACSSPKTPAIPAAAPDPGQLFADLGTCALDSGEKIEGCRIGYRTYGKLDATKSNLVLFPTWFTGTTKTLDKLVPEKMVDTNRFFLVLVDALGNGVSSSPSNSTTQPRQKFPRFTIHDMVESQRRLMREVLKVEKAHTIMGMSMGGMQTFEWAVSHPDEVERIVPIVGSPQLATQDLLLWQAELHILQGSKAFKDGNYEGMPVIPGLQEIHWLNLTSPNHRGQDTSRAAFPGWLDQKTHDNQFDWNDWYRQLEAMLAHDVARADGGDLAKAAQRVKAKGLVIVATQDHMVNPVPAQLFAEAMKATFVSLDTPCGHMAGSCDPLPPKVRPFMEQ